MPRHGPNRTAFLASVPPTFNRVRTEHTNDQTKAYDMAKEWRESGAFDRVTVRPVATGPRARTIWLYCVYAYKRATP